MPILEHDLMLRRHPATGNASGDVKALYIGPDSDTRRALAALFDENGVPLEMTGPGAVFDVLRSAKFHLIILDVDSPVEILSALRCSGSHTKTAILTLAPPSSSGGAALRAGGSAVVFKPFHLGTVVRAVKALTPLINIDRRTYIRWNLAVPVTVIGGSGSHAGQSVDISRSGILVRGVAVAPGDRVRLSFRLPGAAAVIIGEAVAVRCDDGAETGFRFTSFDPACLQQFNVWFDDRLVNSATLQASASIH